MSSDSLEQMGIENAQNIREMVQDLNNRLWAMNHKHYTIILEFDMTFSEALYEVKQGAKIQRAGWNGKGLWVELQTPDEHSKMTLPYLFMCYPADAINTPNARVPWLASQTDILADDWQVVVAS